MKKQFVIVGLFFVASFVGAEALDPYSGSYKALTAREPDEFSLLQLRFVRGVEYSVDLAVVAPNRTHHTGHIQGSAMRDGNVFTLTKQNILPDHSADNPATCVLKMQIDGNMAKVLSEDGCAGYGGAAVSFVEQCAKLIRVHSRIAVIGFATGQKRTPSGPNQTTSSTEVYPIPVHV
jgi:hypothetical protein